MYNDDFTKFTELERLNEALFYAHDLLNRAQIPYIALKETARSIKEDGVLAGKEITFGVLKKDYTELTSKILDTILPEDAVIDDYAIQFDRAGCHVHIKRLKANYRFFQRPDLIFYIAEPIPLPNPFADYWRMRSFIR